MMHSMRACYNEHCKYNNDRVCSLRKKRCAWRVRQEMSHDGFDVDAGSSDSVQQRKRKMK